MQTESEGRRRNAEFSGCKIHFAHEIIVNDYSYMVIFGSYAYRSFISIPYYWHVACEASNMVGSIRYNKEKLIAAGLDEEPAKQIAIDIDEWLKRNND